MTLAAPEEDQWLFTPAQLQQTPSQADGWTYRTELGDRARCIRDLESILLRTQYVQQFSLCPVPQGQIPTYSDGATSS